MSRVLFFTECMPIRNDLTHYAAVARSRWGGCVLHWSQLDHEAYRIFCTHAVMGQIVEKAPTLSSYVLTTTPDEEAELLKLVRPWDEAGVAFWLDLIRGVARDEFAVFDQILDRIRSVYPFDTLVMWGGNGYVKSYCERHGILPVFMELAPLRSPFPSTVYADPRGVNGMHSATQLSLADLRARSDELIHCEILVDRLVDNPLKDPGVFDHAQYCRSEPWSAQARRKKTVLIPFQIRDDVNILLHSPFASMAEFAENVIAELPSDEYHLVFKPHPGIFTRGGLTLKDHSVAQAIVDRCSYATWHEEELAKTDYLSFLTNFDAVVTINSSVGFEASMLGIPVAALGEAPYKLKGSLRTVAGLKEALRGGIDELIRDQHLVASFLFMTSFVREEKLREDPAAFQARLEIMRSHPEGDWPGFNWDVAAIIPYQTWPTR